MPQKNVCDPIIMSQDQVNKSIEDYLKKIGFYNVYPNDKNGSPDLTAEKSGWKLMVKSKGNQAIKSLGTDIVFDDSQLNTHLSDQMRQLMGFYQHAEKKTIFILGNPDIERIRNKVKNIEKVLDKLGFVQFWVQSDYRVKVEATGYVKEILELLDVSFDSERISFVNFFGKTNFKSE